MKIYLIERMDNIGYDKYDSFVVRAENEEQAYLICCDEYHFDKEHAVVKEITIKGKTEKILGSYRAG